MTNEYDYPHDPRVWHDLVVDHPRDESLCGTVTVKTEEMARAVGAALKAAGFVVSLRKFTETKALKWSEEKL